MRKMLALLATCGALAACDTSPNAAALKRSDLVKVCGGQVVIGLDAQTGRYTFIKTGPLGWEIRGHLAPGVAPDQVCA